MNWAMIKFLLVAALTLSGLFMLLSGVVGIFKFRYALTRIHAAALFDTVGILLMGTGVMIATGWSFTVLKMIGVILALWLTSPVASHLIGRMEITINDELDKSMDILDKAAIEKEREEDTWKH